MQALHKEWSWLMAFFASAPEEQNVYSLGPISVARSWERNVLCWPNLDPAPNGAAKQWRWCYKHFAPAKQRPQHEFCAKRLMRIFIAINHSKRQHQYLTVFICGSVD